MVGDRTLATDLSTRDRTSQALSGQVLAIGSAAAALGAQVALQPYLDGSRLLLGVAALIVAAALSGPLAALTATVVLVGGGWLLNAGLPLAEAVAQVALLAALGVAAAALSRQWRRREAALAERLAAQSRDLMTLKEAEARLTQLRGQLIQVWDLNSMGEIASILSHELNQPLSAVANYLRAARNMIARMELQDDDLIEAVARAGDQAVRAGEIVRTMRDLATRGGTLQKPESLSSMIGEIEFIVSEMAREADVAVSYDLAEGDDSVMADRIQIQQLVVNLAQNAIEAVTKYPTRQISISTRPRANGDLVTTVEDSGPGVDPSVASRLFQPLASTKPEGMGLGLSICSAIVENHKGRLWVENSRLGGAAFCFVLARAGDDGDSRGRSDGLRRR